MILTMRNFDKKKKGNGKLFERKIQKTISKIKTTTKLTEKN